MASKLTLLRWLAVVPAACLGWIASLAFGLIELRVLDSLCPPDQWVSGMCVADWYDEGFWVASLLGAAVAAFLVVTLASFVAPSHRRIVALSAYFTGAGFAIYFGIALAEYSAMAAALVTGLLAVALVAKASRRFETMPGDAAADTETIWPDDADGGVFRRMLNSGFDFSKDWPVDFNVDFVSWPPPRAAIELLHARYGPVRVVEPTGDFNGYCEFQVVGKVTYDAVTQVQREVSDLMEPFGGVCETWGVMH